MSHAKSFTPWWFTVVFAFQKHLFVTEKRLMMENYRIVDINHSGQKAN